MSSNQIRKTYCVWDNDNKDRVVAIDQSAETCAALMGIPRQTFYAYLSRPVKKWTIIKSERIK